MYERIYDLSSKQASLRATIFLVVYALSRLGLCTMADYMHPRIILTAFGALSTVALALVPLAISDNLHDSIVFTVLICLAGVFYAAAKSLLSVLILKTYGLPSYQAVAALSAPALGVSATLGPVSAWAISSSKSEVDHNAYDTWFLLMAGCTALAAVIVASIRSVTESSVPKPHPVEAVGAADSLSIPLVANDALAQAGPAGTDAQAPDGSAASVASTPVPRQRKGLRGSRTLSLLGDRLLSCQWSRGMDPALPINQFNTLLAPLMGSRWGPGAIFCFFCAFTNIVTSPVVLMLVIPGKEHDLVLILSYALACLSALSALWMLAARTDWDGLQTLAQRVDVEREEREMEPVNLHVLPLGALAVGTTLAFGAYVFYLNDHELGLEKATTGLTTVGAAAGCQQAVGEVGERSADMIARSGMLPAVPVVPRDGLAAAGEHGDASAHGCARGRTALRCRGGRDATAGLLDALVDRMERPSGSSFNEYFDRLLRRYKDARRELDKASQRWRAFCVFNLVSFSLTSAIQVVFIFRKNEARCASERARARRAARSSLRPVRL
jgi:hypothetical protein